MSVFSESTSASYSAFPGAYVCDWYPSCKTSRGLAVKSFKSATKYIEHMIVHLSIDHVTDMVEICRSAAPSVPRGSSKKKKAPVEVPEPAATVPLTKKALRLANEAAAKKAAKKAAAEEAARKAAEDDEDEDDYEEEGDDAYDHDPMTTLSIEDA
jgi:uncharacterized membrane protein